MRLLQLQLPIDQLAVGAYPVLRRAGILYHHGQVGKGLAVAGLRHLAHNLLLVDVLLQRQQYLVGVDGLNQVVGYLRADGLLHDVLLLALGDHHYGHGRRHAALLDARQRLQAAQARHVLVKQHQVEGLLAAEVDGVGSVGSLHHLVAFLLQKQDVGAQQLNLVVNPQQSSIAHSLIGL